MRLMIFLMLSVLALSACNLEELQSVKDNISEEKVWVFAQFNVPEKDGKFEEFFYYGKVSKPLYESIKKNKIKNGFILLDDVMYWGREDLIYEYADNENEGELIFRIEDLRKMVLVVKAPVAGKGVEQFETATDKKIINASDK